MGLVRVGQATERKVLMRDVAFVFVILSALGLVTSGCAAAQEQGSGTPTTPAVPVAQAVAMPAAEAQPLHAGITRGAMDDSLAHQWQTDLLAAIGRDGQYALFQYVFAGDDPNGGIYVGLPYEPLGLTPEQMNAASEVQARFAKGPMDAVTRDKIWIANAWTDRSGKVATTN